jgi:UDP-N-acetylmuramoylalanine--D-glutamate ligase
VISRVKDLPQAVNLATRVAEEGDIVLLSPGGTSFDAYVDFDERGRHFRELVNLVQR